MDLTIYIGQRFTHLLPVVLPVGTVLRTPTGIEIDRTTDGKRPWRHFGASVGDRKVYGYHIAKIPGVAGEWKPGPMEIVNVTERAKGRAEERARLSAIVQARIDVAQDHAHHLEDEDGDVMDVVSHERHVRTADLLRDILAEFAP